MKPIVTLLTVLPISFGMLAVAAGQGPATFDNVLLQIQEQLDIPCRSSGLIASSAAEEGMLVKPDMPLMQLIDTRERLEVDRLQRELEIVERQAESRVDIEFTEKSIAVAKAELARAQESNTRFPGLVPEPEVDRLRLLVDRAEAELKKAEFAAEVHQMQKKVKEIELAKSRLELEDRKIPAPILGRIEEVYKRAGEWVNVSEPVVRLVRLDVLKVEVKVPAHLGPLTLAGAAATFYPAADWLAGQAFQGRVDFVQSQINPVDGTVRVLLEIDNPDLVLRPGMNGRVEIVFPDSSPSD